MRPLFQPSQGRHFGRSVSGFTLIELIMVIVILGVLAAAALPKFMDLQRDARLAKLQALQGVLISTANQMRALCKLQYTQCGDAYGHITAMPNGQAPHVTMDGRDFGMQHGWPAPFDGYGLSSGYASFARALNLGGIYVRPYVGSSFEMEFQIPEAPDPANCKVTYRTWFWAAGNSPTYAITNTGC